MRTLSIRLAPVLALGLAFAPPVTGGDKDSSPLVRRLASPRYSEREAATRQLEALGEPALPALRRAAQEGEPEVRQRAAQIIAAIERRSEAARLLRVTRVRLNVKDVRAHKAIRELASLAGLSDDDLAFLSLVPEAMRKVTLDTGTTTFWEALDRLCEAAQLTVRPAGRSPDEVEALADNGSGAPIRLLDKPGKPLPTFRAGALRLTALPVDFARQVNGTGAKSGETGFLLEVRPEPKRAWQGVAGLRVTRAIDDRGQRLVQPQAHIGAATGPAPDSTKNRAWDGMSGRPIAPASTTPVPVRLTAGKLPSTKLKEIEGVVTVRVQAIRPVLVIDDVLKAEGKTVRDNAGRYGQVMQVSRDGAALEVRVQMQPQGTDGAAGGFQVVRNRKGVVWMRGSSREALAEMALADAKGNVLARTSRRALVPNPKGGLLLEFMLRYTPTAGAQPPSRLVCSGPATVAVDVPFTLRDVPIAPEALPVPLSRDNLYDLPPP
ncbi:MAG: hypothetical protein L0Z62_35190 [Gemmataceae bacterium]|nr:hypothetical protein [Gemmataceae bacterium]